MRRRSTKRNETARFYVATEAYETSDRLTDIAEGSGLLPAAGSMGEKELKENRWEMLAGP